MIKSNLLHSMIVATLAGGIALAPNAVEAQQGPRQLGALDRVVAVSQSTIEPVFASEEVTLMSADLRTVGNSGLLVQLSAECGLWAELGAAPPDDGDDDDVGDDGDGDDGDGTGDDTGDDTGDALAAASSGRVLVWVEVDGDPLSFVGADEVDAFADGRVAFCSGDADAVAAADPDDPMALFDATRSATTFNWTVQPRPNGPVTVEIKAIFESDLAIENGEDALLPQTALAAVGNRTLVVQPIALGR